MSEALDLERLYEVVRARLEAVKPSPVEVFPSLLDVFAVTRVLGCDIENGGDMLLFQWGTYGAGSEERFDIDLTRQLSKEVVLDPDQPGLVDTELHQLSVTFRFAPTDELRQLEDGDRWCDNPEGVAAFAEYVLASGPMAAVGHRQDGELELWQGAP